MSTNFEIDNFCLLLNQNVEGLLEQAADGMFREAAFTQTVTEYFTDAEEAGNIQICTSIHRNKGQIRQRQINAYAIWDDYETFDVFIADYSGGGLYNAEKAKVTTSLGLAYRYFRYLQDDNAGHAEESAAENELIRNYREFKDRILRVRIILLTDGVLKSGFSAPKTVADDDVIFEVWDLQRIYQVWSAQGRREPVEIDLPEQFGYRLPFLKADQSSDNYSAYLTIAPASLLADLYNTYGTRLLEQNVRVYLQNLGKVNREIRKTILDSPGMFMAYNNGISATVSDITFERDTKTDLTFIRHLGNLQIVNGGQTTSSIFYARKKDRADLSKINIQLKITCVNDEKQVNEVVAKISKYANSQNKVSEIDLTSNQPYQIRLEELSRTTWANPKTGSGQHTRWFYERVKGQYKEELNKEFTPGRKAAFRDRNPSYQVLRKEEFAKYRNCWSLLPFWVARGSQKNYLHFIGLENHLQPLRDYFKETVAIALLFKAAEDIYGKKPNSMGDLRYLVVPYAISWLNFHTGQRLDLQKIWSSQSVVKSIKDLLCSCLLKINAFFQEEKPDEFALISEWAKREECWKLLASKSPKDMGLDFSAIAAELKELTILTTNSAANEQYAGYGLADWEMLETIGQERQTLDLFQLNVIRNVIRRLKTGKTLPPQLEQQASALLQHIHSTITPG